MRRVTEVNREFIGKLQDIKNWPETWPEERIQEEAERIFRNGQESDQVFLIADNGDLYIARKVEAGEPL